jgi:penicillin-insensitive murein endopeptidase
VDIWFLLLQGKPQRVLSEQERETWGATSMLSGNGIDAAQWTATHEKILATAASLAHVERIFVNPLIKRELCHNALDNNREWLRKIRPWWHHDDHFHVRLSCPEDNKHCTHQDPLPAGDGCGADLAWWFSAEANAPAKKPAAPPKAVELPALCEQVLQEQ